MPERLHLEKTLSSSCILAVCARLRVVLHKRFKDTFLFWQHVFALFTSTCKPLVSQASGAHTAPPSPRNSRRFLKSFTIVLDQTHCRFETMFNSLCNSSELLQVIFCSSDRTEHDMLSYVMHHHGNWFAIPYKQRELKGKLSARYDDDFNTLWVCFA